MEILRTFTHNDHTLLITGPEPVSAAPTAWQPEPGPLRLAPDQISAGEPLTLTAQLTGSGVAYIHTEILLRDRELGLCYGPIARAFVRAAQEKTTGGLTRPRWEPAIDLSMPLTPGLRLITNSVDSAFAFLFPAAYDSADVYLDGLHTGADGAPARRARLTFDNTGEIKKTLVFTEKRGRSLPHALSLAPGDQFSPFVHLLTPPSAENPAWQETHGLSNPLICRAEPFRLISQPPLPGDYLAALLIQDLDGQISRQVAPFSIV